MFIFPQVSIFGQYLNFGKLFQRFTRISLDFDFWLKFKKFRLFVKFSVFGQNLDFVQITGLIIAVPNQNILQNTLHFFVITLESIYYEFIRY